MGVDVRDGDFREGACQEGGGGKSLTLLSGRSAAKQLCSETDETRHKLRGTFSGSYAFCLDARTRPAMFVGGKTNTYGFARGLPAVRFHGATPPR